MSAVVSVQFSMPNLGNDVSIQSRPANCSANPCTITIPEGNTTLTWRIVAAQNLQPGQRSGNGTIKATSGAGTKEASFTVTVTGTASPSPTPTQEPGVTEVSGTVKDSTTGQAISGATVKVIDSANKTFTTGTNSAGQFKVLPGTGERIAPGSLTVEASKDKFDAFSRIINGIAGQAASTEIRLVPNASASASPPPSVEPASAEPAAAASNTAAAPVATAQDSGLSGLQWAGLGLGALMVILGIGAIVLLLRRGKEDDYEDEDDPNAPAGRGGPTPPSHGVYRAGPGGGVSDATMVARSEPAMARANSDATAIVRPQRGPDPGYDGYPATDGRGGYGAGGFGDETQVSGYGLASGRGGQYGGGYNDDATRHHDLSGGYTDDATRHHDMSGGRHDGYDQRGGYDDRAGYGDQGSYGRGGDQRGGYDDRAGYGSQEPGPRRSAPPAGRGERPRLDWLDD